MVHDSLVAAHTNNYHDCIVQDGISKKQMFENQHIKMEEVMYKITNRKKDVDAKI